MTAAGLLAATVAIHRPQASGSFVALGFLVLTLELSAARLPGFGFFSSSPAVALAMALVASIGPGGAAVGVALGLAARTVLRPVQHPLRGALADAVPALAAVGTVGLIGPPEPSDSAALLVPGLAGGFAWLVLGVAFLPAGLAALTALGLATLFWLVPVLFGVQHLAGLAAWSPPTSEHRAAKLRLTAAAGRSRRPRSSLRPPAGRASRRPESSTSCSG